jgi:phosphate transport system substrate-binding protein
MHQTRHIRTACTCAAVLASSLWAANVNGQAGRDYVDIVGSSTVYPFSTVVAERFGRRSEYRTPKVESTGSGGGFKLFCDGIGVDFPDIANSSRRIKKSELANCIANGVTEVIEVKIGYDGIVIANDIGAESIALTRRDIFLAMAKHVPGERPGDLIENPHRTWRDVNPSLPGIDIEVLGPPPTSGTRDTFVELAMEGGCRSFGWVAGLEETDYPAYRSLCHTFREDGAFVEAGENDNLIVQKLQTNPIAVGIFGFNFLDQNPEKVKAASIDGVLPTFDAIHDGIYPVSRPLYFYVKKAHVDVIPGMRGFLQEFTSERAWGDEGYLSDRGLIPLDRDERYEIASLVRSLTPLAALAE